MGQHAEAYSKEICFYSCGGMQNNDLHIDLGRDCEYQVSAILKVQDRGQVTLPKDVREQLHILPGSLLICTVEPNGDIRLTRVPKMTFEEMFGSWKTQPRTDGTEVEAEIHQAMEDAADELLRNLGG